ncbi:MAG: TonB-dependent receptor domain-containing protein [Candidatus Cyclobacteriaceae bacterium M3_2C_046]
MSYRSLFLLFLMFISIHAAGQSSLTISGKVLDNDQQPVPFAQVALYEPDGETPLKGTVTQEDGSFQLMANEGQYDLSITFVGYKDKTIEDISLKNSPARLGIVEIAPSPQQLKEVIIEKEKIRQPVTTDLEGLNVNPEQTISNIGGSLLDVLRNTPSVNVDQEGNVSIRGSSSTNVLIDGRNSALASDLEQIPASAVKNIKIVNNPNAKYDAEGAGGVINIQLKKGEDKGTNGKVEGTIGTRYRMNGSLRLNHRADRFNVYGGYSYRSWPGVGNSLSTRETYDDNRILRQIGDRSRNDREHTFNFGADYYFGKSKISYEGAVNMETEKDIDQNATRLFNSQTNDIVLEYLRENTETEDNHTLDNALIYERIFENSDREFRAVVSHSFRDQLENQDIDVYNNQIIKEGNPTGMERSANDEYNTTTILQVDYVHPFDQGKLEAGYKSTFRSLDNDYDYEIRDRNTGVWVNQDQISNRFLYKDQIHAAYAIYSHSFDKLKLSAGLRLEQTLVDTKLFDTNEENEQNYLNLFPSLQSQYLLNDKHSVKFTYSRRIDRPGSWWLNPFPDISDSLNVRIGNPNIQPEFIHSLELGHMVNFERASITTNLFYRHVDGQVDYIVTIDDGISFRQPTNLLTSETYGLEIINTTEIFPWWNMNASYSIFQTSVDGSNLDADYTNNGLSWNAKLTTDISLPYDIDLQLTGNYTAPEIEAQGRDLARYYLDVSLQRPFLDDQANVSLSFRDVFDTRNFQGENFGENFQQRFNYNRESQIVLLSLGYNF